jgi:Arc/MetJ family transcription regulator
MKMDIEIDDKLLDDAQRITGITDKNIIIERALLLYVTVKCQNKLKDLWGTVKLDDKASN